MRTNYHESKPEKYISSETNVKLTRRLGEIVMITTKDDILWSEQRGTYT